MELRLAMAIPSRRASAEYFTGTVWVETIIEAPAPARIRAARVTFEPGGRTFWHTHPLGQTLYVLSGVGLVQSWGKTAQVIRPGDVVWIPPGEKHWHGASPDKAMTHIALQESRDGATVEWLEAVSDPQYAEAAR
ncbi:MAG TPA: cupin domain-containing protein [Acetobacteraceae bacterium]|nr:cupin domain-containing protein [Acetobacteraceae bacterium]